MRVAVISYLLFFASVALAVEIEGVNLLDKISWNEREYVLNGVGLREKKKFGMNFKVYVAGLYLQTPSVDAEAILKSETPKILELVFLRTIDAKTLREAWSEGFAKNCASDCDLLREHLARFNALMGDVKSGSRLRLVFLPQTVEVNVTGAQASKGKVEGENFSQRLLSVFIGQEPPSEKFKNGLLKK